MLKEKDYINTEKFATNYNDGYWYKIKMYRIYCTRLSASSLVLIKIYKDLPETPNTGNTEY